MSNFVDEINNLENRINDMIRNLNINQPYIKYNNLKLYFRNFSPKVDAIQNNENCLKFKYHSHNVKPIEDDSYSQNDDIHEQINLSCSDINNYINSVENTQIIKELTLSFSLEHNSNFLDYELLNNLIDKYINDKLILKYNKFNIIDKYKESNENCILYELCINTNKKKLYEYFLIINSICVNVTLNSFCNKNMSDIIRKMLLSCSFSEKIGKEDIYLDIAKDELDLAFEINSKNDYFKNNDNILSIENSKELNKLNKLLNKFSDLKKDNNFDNDIAFNIIILGNDTCEKNYLLNLIENSFKENIESNESLNVFDIDIENNLDFFNNSEKKITEKLKAYNFLIINNFDTIIDYESQIQFKIIKIIINLKKYFGIIICGDIEKTSNILKNNKDLSDKFSFVFECRDYTIDMIYDLLMSKLKITNYKISLEPNKTKEILKLLLEKSKAKNEKFINNLYTKMLKYLIENELTEFNIRSLPVINQKDIINNTIKDLNNLIGLENVKKEVNKLIAFWKFKNDTKQIANFNNQYFNMFLTGNSGTGKTTIAKLIEKILYSLNYVKEDKFIEITPNDLVADYEGQTKTKTKEILNQAKGGILFIDEAYLFLNDGQYFKEALVELIKYMENYQNIVIFAGYSDLMKDLLNLNSGLKSRITTFINFDNYTKKELIKILNFKLNNQNFSIDDEALKKINTILDKVMKEKNFGNARYIDKLTTKILMKHSENVYLKGNKNLLTITKDDIDENEILNDGVKNNSNFGFIQKNGDV